MKDGHIASRMSNCYLVEAWVKIFRDFWERGNKRSEKQVVKVNEPKRDV